LILLLVPLIVMQVTDEVQWGIFDFAFAACLLSAAGISYALLTAKRKKVMTRWVIGLLILALIILIWVEAAVGILP